MSLSQYVGLFSAESREHINTINHLLLDLEADPSAREAVEGLFRSVHTIKGMSATLGFSSVADLAHEMEGVLEQVRGERLPAGSELIDVLFAAVDALSAGVEDAVAERDPSCDVGPLVAQLRALAKGGTGGAVSTTPESISEPLGHSDLAVAATKSEAVDALPLAGTHRYRVRAVVAASASLPGVRAYLLVQKAKQIGEVDELTPSEDDLQAGVGFGGVVEFRLTAFDEQEAVRERLASVGELATLELLALAQPTAPASEAMLPLSPSSVTGFAPVPVARHIDRHVRIDAERLDSLMDQVGELVVLRDRLHRVARARGGADLLEPVDLAARLIGELRDEVMRIRMVPMGEVFDRFPRLVRDAARALEKKVEFVVHGSEIEVDRSLLGRLGDPLVHLLRNSIDHGIESPAERRNAGKPEVGRIRVEAERERSRVLIRVSDDGRGINRELVIAKAVEKGLVTPADAAVMAEADVLDLVTRAGFSTAEAVTDVSGRGVGLDVVATEVRALGGTVVIDSTPGKGTTFLLRMPVTVGILRAVLVRIGADTYALPVAHVAETVEFRRADVHTAAGRRVVFFRDEALPLLSLRELLGMPAGPTTSESLEVVLLELADDLVGLEVDALLGQQEIVIKPFDATRDTLPYFSGATILSDGSPALILDASSLLQHGRLEGTLGGDSGDSSFLPVPVVS